MLNNKKEHRMLKEKNKNKKAFQRIVYLWGGAVKVPSLIF
jgi:hypothetical protein